MSALNVCLRPKSFFVCLFFEVNSPSLSHQRSLDFRESREAEPHHLWEYPCRALTQSTDVMTFDFTQCLPQEPISSQGSLPFTRFQPFHHSSSLFTTKPGLY